MVCRAGVKLGSLAMVMALLMFAVTPDANARTSRSKPAHRAARIYTCHFPKGGTVVIDTREPGASITVRGKRYPAQSGAYFYQGIDNDVFVAFGPGARFKFWEYEGERDYHCRAS